MGFVDTTFSDKNAEASKKGHFDLFGKPFSAPPRPSSTPKPSRSTE
jgi:hypothetical protein